MRSETTSAGPGALLGEEVAQRPVERAREPHAAPVAADEREGSLDRAHVGRGTARDAGPRLVDGHVANAVLVGVGQVDDAFDVLVVHGSLPGPPMLPRALSSGDFGPALL